MLTPRFDSWTRPRRVRRAAALLLLALLAAGCGGTTRTAESGERQRAGWCDSLVADPTTGSPAPGALDRSLRSCANVDDWLRVVRDHPGLLGGREPLEVLDERCADSASGLASFAVCRSRELALATPPPTPRATRPPQSTPPPRTAGRRPQPEPPTSRSDAGVTIIEPAFFGPDVTIRTFEVQGTTALEVATDLQTAGPRMAWLGGSASAVTRPLVHQRFTLATDPDEGCRIVQAEPAIAVSFIVTLPRWSPPRNVGRATIAWWNRVQLEIARHERIHVRIVRDSVAEANRVLDRSTCATLVPRLKAVWLEMRRRNCRFDMAEYGRAHGLSRSECVRG